MATKQKSGPASILGTAGRKAEEAIKPDISMGTVNTEDPYGTSTVKVNKDGSRTVETKLSKDEQKIKNRGDKIIKQSQTGAGSILGNFNKDFKGGFDVLEGIDTPKIPNYGDIGTVTNIDPNKYGNQSTLDWQGLSKDLSAGDKSSDIINRSGQTSGLDFTGNKWAGQNFDDILREANAYGDQTYNRHVQRMNPEFQRQQQAFTESMINRGIATGSNPYQRSLQSLSEQQSRSMLDAADMADQMGMNLAVQGGNLAQKNLETQGNLINQGVRTNQLGAELGIRGAESDVDRATNVAKTTADLQGQSFDQGLSNQQLNLDAEKTRIGTDYDNKLLQTDWADKSFNQGMDVAKFGADANVTNYIQPLGAASILNNIATGNRAEKPPTNPATFTPPNYGNTVLGFEGIEASERNSRRNTATPAEYLTPGETSEVDNAGLESGRPPAPTTSTPTAKGSFNPKAGMMKPVGREYG